LHHFGFTQCLYSPDLTKIREDLKIRPEEGGKVIKVRRKIQARAIQIVDYIKTTIQDDPLRKKEIALDTQQARILFSGAGGEACKPQGNHKSHEESRRSPLACPEP
jgi:hypothetical protein